MFSNNRILFRMRPAVPDGGSMWGRPVLRQIRTARSSPSSLSVLSAGQRTARSPTAFDGTVETGGHAVFMCPSFLFFLIYQENGIPFETEPRQDSTEGHKKCAVQLQKETPLGLVDDFCGNEVEKGLAGLCRWYISSNLKKNVTFNVVGAETGRFFKSNLCGRFWL